MNVKSESVKLLQLGRKTFNIFLNEVEENSKVSQMKIRLMNEVADQSVL